MLSSNLESLLIYISFYAPMQHPITESIDMAIIQASLSKFLLAYMSENISKMNRSETDCTRSFFFVVCLGYTSVESASFLSVCF